MSLAAMLERKYGAVASTKQKVPHDEKHDPGIARFAYGINLTLQAYVR